MKNKGFIALVFTITLLVGGAISFASASPADAQYYGYGYDDYYGYGGYGYDDYYGYGGYGYDDYYGGYGNYGYDDYYGYGGYGYDDYYGYGGYGYDDSCYYGCGGYYDYYDDYCYYDCYDYDYPRYNDYCYSCNPAPSGGSSNVNNNNNNNVNENINNITIRNYIGGYSEPVVREREREVRRDPLVCTPASQTTSVNQSVSVRVSGGTGTYNWNAPGSQNISGRGDTISLRYPISGLKTITVSSGGETATCFVQVTGGQVLAEFIEFPNTGGGGSAQLPSVIALVSAILAIIIASIIFVRRAILA